MATQNYNNSNFPAHAQFHPQAPQPIMTTAGYPPQHDAMYTTLNSTTTFETKVADDPRLINRTPSPTPSEAKELKTGAIDWKQITNWRFWFRREWLWYYVILVVILVITALVTIYHTQIVNWLTPFTKWLHGLKFGWLVPIGILFVISFPPLFGHEIVAILCGLVWGLWAGFGIVAAGTFLGEVGNFYAFKYCCRSRGEKLEKTKISYACLARVVRDGGFKIALIARLSAIPGHFTTAIFSTCGMNIFVFSIAAILSSPKQFITVYLGVILAQTSTGVQDTKSKIISDTVLAITFIVTIAAMWYILRQMNKVKPQVIYERRKARQQKLLRADNGSSPYGVNTNPGSSTTSVNDVFNPNGSDSDIPLTQQRYQQWDQHGNAVGYAPDPTLHTPQPRVVNNTPAFLGGQASGSRYPRDEEEAGGQPFITGGRPTREDSGDSVGWDTGRRGEDPSTTQFLPLNVPGPARPIPTHLAAQNTLQNPHSQPHQAGFEPEVMRTPTQANFVNDQQWRANTDNTTRATYGHNAHQSSYEDPYGGYTATTTEITHRHGHLQQSTDASYGTALTSSPDDDDVSHVHRLPLTNPHDAHAAGPFAPPPGPPPTGSNNPYYAAGVVYSPAVPAQQQPSQQRAQSPNPPPSYMTNPVR
ncbi:hypothetical protein CPB84DRAFT_1769149 [Gymnopilus junonius]|uniref:Golgi apparatus membrane protein TVP38 n=1 Tax=Gymnopilus junonius TaxID=109634 RepID=A0A9P5TQM6_GYMJU|nr:hypothetical protein CPB84DRAFT_1769149 [Gymnopilus junonius]